MTSTVVTLTLQRQGSDKDVELTPTPLKIGRHNPILSSSQGSGTDERIHYGTDDGVAAPS